MARLVAQDRDSGRRVHLKPNLGKGHPGMKLPDEYPARHHRRRGTRLTLTIRRRTVEHLRVAKLPVCRGSLGRRARW
ncbi:hypothetical protein GCM10017688_15520 [Streptomyces ramulosus]